MPIRSDLLTVLLSSLKHSYSSSRCGISSVIVDIECVEGAIIEFVAPTTVVVAVEAISFEIRCVIRHRLYSLDRLFDVHLMRYPFAATSSARWSVRVVVWVRVAHRCKHEERFAKTSEADIAPWKQWNQKLKENNHWSVCTATQSISRWTMSRTPTTSYTSGASISNFSVD